jgi:hypothetical protein
MPDVNEVAGKQLLGADRLPLPVALQPLLYGSRGRSRASVPCAHLSCT